MKILVTGHKGFIGSRLFDDLRYEQRYGYGVEGLDSPDDIVFGSQMITMVHTCSCMGRS